MIVRHAATDYIENMTATEIIDEIKHLPPEERARVESYFSEQAREARQLSGDELGRMAEQLIESGDPVQKAALREKISKGFYGD